MKKSSDPTLWRERILKREFEIVLGKMLQPTRENSAVACHVAPHLTYAKAEGGRLTSIFMRYPGRIIKLLPQATAQEMLFTSSA